MPDTHPLAAANPLRVAMLGAEPLIVYAAHGADENMLHGLRRALGREPKVHRTSSTLSVLALVAAGLGVALVPEPLMQMRIPGVAYCRLDDMEQQADLLLVSRNGESGGAVRAFLGIARGALVGG
ncbi:DNA-binding transcriptional activator XapR [compost metagenome]